MVSKRIKAKEAMKKNSKEDYQEDSLEERLGASVNGVSWRLQFLETSKGFVFLRILDKFYTMIRTSATFEKGTISSLKNNFTDVRNIMVTIAFTSHDNL